LRRRLSDLYGSRFFDIPLSDSLYAQIPVLELVHQIGWDAVISLKTERARLVSIGGPPVRSQTAG